MALLDTIILTVEIFSVLHQQTRQPDQHHVGRQIGTHTLRQLARAELEAAPAGPPGSEKNAVLLDAIVQAENHFRNQAND